MQGSGSSSRARALRRYPALAFLALAAVLAVLLPSALTVPNSGPPTLAEFAPVPGHGPQGSGDLGRLGSGSSGGLGTNGGSGGPGQPVDPGQPPSSLKRCVGRPLRQTEDPLSPPCVAFWEGDNGGATARGVTKDEVSVVIYWGSRSDSNGGAGFEDYDRPVAGDDGVNDQIGKAFARFFNARYQLYGRRLHLFGYYGSSSTTAAQARADIVAIDSLKHPFAMISQDLNRSAVATVEAARRGMVAVSKRGFLRSLYADAAPNLISYDPDLEQTAAIGAGFLCGKLRGPARFSGNVTDRETRRSFGVLYTDSPDDPTDKQLALAFVDAARRRCGERVRTYAVEGAGTSTYDQYPTALASMRGDGVTTAVPITKGGDPLTYLPAARGIGWFPEWFIVRLSGAAGGIDDTPSARTYPQDEWRNAFGISHDVRRDRPTQQSWYTAFAEGCACQPAIKSYNLSRTYDTLALLMYGIQVAGPRLSATSLDKGLHSVAPRASTSAYRPATYFGAGTYSWVKDAKEMWWDPSGVPPGETQPGCYRLVRDGRRSRADEWSPGDAGLFAAGQPCQGSAQLP